MILIFILSFIQEKYNKILKIILQNKTQYIVVNIKKNKNNLYIFYLLLLIKIVKFIWGTDIFAPNHKVENNSSSAVSCVYNFIF